VRLPNPVGDAVLATPALRALRAALPSTRITWAGGPAAQAVLEGLGERDGVVPLAGPLARGARAPWRAARLLRRIGADAALLLTNSFSSALAVRVAGIPTRVGTDLDARGPLLTHRIEVPRDERDRPVPRPMTRHYLDLVAPFGAEDDGQRPRLATTAFDEERAARRLAGVPGGSVLVAVNPGAAFGATKVYPPERIAAAVAAVRERTGILPLVLCGPGEQALAAALADRLGPACLSTHERPASLGELKGLLRRVRLLLTTDAGPRHVAEAFGIPTVVWMGPTDPRWSEGGPATLVRREDLPCLGCHLARCPLGAPCLQELDPQRIADAAIALLA
jgi:heptosyltransferase-2